jgi:3-hydroxyisobutyrate dehydrogenase-like beta-hydroxyacid dehydrogenase
MGGAMARRLHGQGFRLILWNRDRSRSEALALEIGSGVAGTPAEAASAGDVVVTSLADDRAVTSVYLGPDGVVQGVTDPSIVIDTSTIDPLTVIEVGKALDGKGVGFADCPVSGSVSTVEAGSLTIMAGGDQAVIDRARPVLEAMATRVVSTGVLGSGAATKLAVNGLVHGLNVALSEALVLAEKAGVDRKVAYEVFAGGAGGAPFVQYKREAYEDPDGATVAFSLELVAKDLELITGLADRVGARMAQAETGLRLVREAIDAGMGGRDLSAIAVYLREAGS